MWALVASVTAIPGPNGGTTGAIDTTGAKLLVMSVSWYAGGGGSPTTLLDSKGNTWLPLTLHQQSDTSQRFWYVKNPTVGSGHTFTASASNIFPFISVLAYSGADLLAPFDVQNGAVTAGASPLSTGSVTPSLPGALIVAAWSGMNGTSAPAIGSGFTLRHSTNPVGGTSLAGATADLFPAAASAINPSWSWTGTDNVAVGIAVFIPVAGGLKQAHWANGDSYGTGTSTRRLPTFTVYQPGSITVAAQVTANVNHAVTIRNWYLRLAAAPGGSVTRTWTVYKNGSPTSLVIAITGANTTGSDVTNSVSFAAGDTTYIEEVVTGGTPVDAGVVQGVFEIENPDYVTSLGTCGEAGTIASTTHYTGLLYGYEWVNTGTPGPTGVDNVVATAGTVTGYRMRLGTAPGLAASGKQRVFVIEKNGTAQDGTGGTPNTTITIAETATTGSASFVLSLAAGDLVRVKMTPVSSPAISSAVGTTTFVATALGKWNLGFSLNDQMATAATEYNVVFGGFLTWIVTEASRENIGPPSSLAPFSFSGMYVDLPTAPGVGKSYTLTLRKNTADSAQTVTISGASTTGTSVGAAVTVDRTDRMALSCTPAGTPTASRIRMAFLMTDPAVPTADVRLTAQNVESLTQNATADVRITSQRVEAITQNTTADVRITSQRIEVLQSTVVLEVTMIPSVWMGDFADGDVWIE